LKVAVAVTFGILGGWFSKYMRKANARQKEKGENISFCIKERGCGRIITARKSGKYDHLANEGAILFGSLHRITIVIRTRIITVILTKQSENMISARLCEAEQDRIARRLRKL
jgi:hypothetical protein